MSRRVTFFSLKRHKKKRRNFTSLYKKVANIGLGPIRAVQCPREFKSLVSRLTITFVTTIKVFVVWNYPSFK